MTEPKTLTTIPLYWRIKCWLNPIIDKKYGRYLWDYIVALWFCQHNARVIVDFEERMSSVIYSATNGRMSKPYYTKESMCEEIEDAFSRTYDDGYRDAKEEPRQ